MLDKILEALAMDQRDAVIYAQTKRLKPWVRSNEILLSEYDKLDELDKTAAKLKYRIVSEIEIHYRGLKDSDYLRDYLSSMEELMMSNVLKNK